MKKLATVIVTLLVVSSLAVGSLAGLGLAQQGGPPDHAGVPSENVKVGQGNEGEGNQGQGGGPDSLPESVPDHAAAWDVKASNHSDDLEVEIGVEGERLTMTVRDDVNHDGREVSVDREALESSLGHEPSSAYGVHEDGEEWTSSIEYDGDYAIFEVPKFSENEVTFEGSVRLSGDPASDGSQYSYDLDDLDAASDPSIHLTGVRNTETDTISANDVEDGETVSADIGGNLDPGDSEITLEGNQYTGDSYSKSGTGDGSFTVNGDTDPSGPDDGEPEIELTGTTKDEGTASHSLGSYTDGDSDSFDIDDLDDTSGESIELAGVENSETDTQSTTLDSGEDQSLDVDGNDEAEISVTLTGKNESTEESGEDPNFISADNTRTQTIYTAPETNEYEVSIDWSASANQDYEHSYYQAWRHYDESEDSNGDWNTIVDDTTHFEFDESGTEEFTIELEEGDKIEHTMEAESEIDDGVEVKYEGSEYVRYHETGDISGDVAGKSFSDTLGEDESTTVTEQVSPGEHSVNLDSSEAPVDVSSDVTETVKTEDPSITLNDNTYSHDGKIADGETESLSIDASDLEEGTNDVDVSLASVDGPTNEVGIDAVEYDDLQYTEDIEIDVDGDGEPDVSRSGELASGEASTHQLSELEDGDVSLDSSVAQGGQPEWEVTYDEELYTTDPGTDIDGDGTDDVSASGKFAPGETHTESISPTLSDDSWEVSSSSGPVDVSAEIEERTETEDPGVELNGEEVSHSGTLEDGETVEKNISSDALQEGTNRVNVSMPDVDGPESQVGLEYTHDAASNQSVDYTAERWHERYNVSKTWADDREDATLTVPFASDRVVGIDDVQVQRDDGSWEDLDRADYELDGTTLEAELGDVSAGEETRVRANGTKMRVENGEIEVTEPSAVGEDLATSFEVTDRDDETIFLEVGSTEDADRLHYLSDQSWSDGDAYTRFKADSEETQVHLPGADIGSTATIETRPLAVSPKTGDVEVEWHDDGTNTKPMFDVRPGGQSGDDVEYTFTDADDGEEYVLNSETDDVVRDSGTANSPLTLLDDDSEETLAFLSEEETEEDDGDDSGGGGFYDYEGPSSVDEAREQALAIAPVIPAEAIALLVLGIIGLGIGYTERENDRDPLHEREEIWVAVGIALLVGVFLLAPTTITGPLETALSAALPLAAVFGVIGGAYIVFSWRQERVQEASTPDQVFRVGAEEVDDQDDDSGRGGWL